MKLPRQLFFWFESYLFEAATPFQKLLSFSFLPFSFIYCVVVWVKKLLSTPEKFGIPIVSVGNLTVGGNGKTPVIMALAKHFERPAVILRGYGRNSKGLAVVSDGSGLLCGVYEAGDEAMMIAKALPRAVVIVSEDRKKAILKAKEMGVQVLFLDDAFGKFSIKKLDILVQPAVLPKNDSCLPSGCYRYPKSFEKFADIVLKEGRDFERVVSTECCDFERLLLVTAIAKPQRLEPYLPSSVVGRVYLPDHSEFDFEELSAALKSHDAQAMLVTAKDAVKLENGALPFCILHLDIEFKKGVSEPILSALQ